MALCHLQQLNQTTDEMGEISPHGQKLTTYSYIQSVLNGWVLLLYLREKLIPSTLTVKEVQASKIYKYLECTCLLRLKSLPRKAQYDLGGIIVEDLLVTKVLTLKRYNGGKNRKIWQNIRNSKRHKKFCV